MKYPRSSTACQCYLSQKALLSAIKYWPALGPIHPNAYQAFRRSAGSARIRAFFRSCSTAFARRSGGGATTRFPGPDGPEADAPPAPGRRHDDPGLVVVKAILSDQGLRQLCHPLHLHDHPLRCTQSYYSHSRMEQSSLFVENPATSCHGDGLREKEKRASANRLCMFPCVSNCPCRFLKLHPRKVKKGKVP